MKRGDQLGIRNEYEEMCASRDIGNYADIRELEDADTHVIVYLPEAIDPKELALAQARAAFAAQEKTEKRAVRCAARRSMQKKKRKPSRQTREKHLLQLWCAILDLGEVFSVKIDHHAITEELRKRIYFKHEYHQLREFEQNDLDLYVAKTPSGEWLKDDFTTYSLDHDELEPIYQRITMWSTVDEFLQMLSAA